MKYLLFLLFAGIGIGLPAQSKTWSLGAEAGLRYTNYQFNFTSASGGSVGVNLHLRTGVKCWLETGLSYAKVRGDELLSSTDTVINGVISRSFRHYAISLPVRFGFELVKTNHFRFALLTGGFASYEGARSFYFDNRFNVNADDIPWQKGLGLGFSGGLRARYDLGKLGIYLQSDVRQGWIPGAQYDRSGDNALHDIRRNFSYGVQLGAITEL